MLPHIALAFALIYSAALVAWWAIPQRTRPFRSLIGLLAGLTCCFASIVIPADAKLVRTLISIHGVITASRMACYWIEGHSATLREYFRFVSFAMLRPYIIFTRDVNYVRPRYGREILRLVGFSALIPPAFMAAQWLVLNTPTEESWWLNHLIILAFVIAGGTCFGRALLALWRLQGLPVKRPVLDNILASRTPADFWHRWNWPAHSGLMRYVFPFAGGRHHPIRATLAVFLASGLAHELLFAIPVGRITGHQTLFFVLSGVGVLAGSWMERRLGRIAMHGFTLAFLIATSPIFFVSWNYVVPIYMKSIWINW